MAFQGNGWPATGWAAYYLPLRGDSVGLSDTARMAEVATITARPFFELLQLRELHEQIWDRDPMCAGEEETCSFSAGLCAATSAIPD
ncbi:MAG: hypothetical protein OXG81_13210 [Acidobacteria bacterium]|nr:hypothetical protein [Acidobacteriota bacterium]